MFDCLLTARLLFSFAQLLTSFLITIFYDAIILFPLKNGWLLFVSLFKFIYEPLQLCCLSVCEKIV